MKTIIGISASLNPNSSNSRIIGFISNFLEGKAELIKYNKLDQLPHFDPSLKEDEAPIQVQEFRKLIQKADGVIISSPEYVFSTPAILKNAIEWTVATTVFMNGIITGSSSGKIGHEALKLIMKTVTGEIDEKCCLLISGVKSKIAAEIKGSDQKTVGQLKQLADYFIQKLENKY